MGAFVNALATTGGQAVVGAAGGVLNNALGMIFGRSQDKRQLRQQSRLQDIQIRGTKELREYDYAKQMEMWENTNYPAQMEQLRKAGLNPGLIYGMSGGGGVTTGGSGGGTSGGTAAAPAPLQQQNIMELGMAQAQLRLMEAQAKKTEAEATKIQGVDTQESQSRIINNTLDAIIKEYTGKEAKAMYEEVNQPNRGEQARARTDELSAIQAFGQNINEMFIEGKLRDKTNAEVEQAMLANSKTRAETRNIVKTFDLIEQNIKGAQLSNIILDLEQKLQTQTGIDKTSAGWLKILGRLFINLTQQ